MAMKLLNSLLGLDFFKSSCDIINPAGVDLRFKVNVSGVGLKRRK